MNEAILHCPIVLVVILNWNGATDTIKCVESLLESRYDCQEILVVDNASREREDKVLSKLFGKRIHVIRAKENYGYTSGNNLGIVYGLKKFAPDYVLILNNDVIVQKDFLHNFIAVAESHKEIGVFSPLIIEKAPDEIHDRVAMGEKVIWSTFKSKKPEGVSVDSRSIIASDTAHGATMLIKKNVIEKVGLLPAHYPFLASDFAYSLRVGRAGLNIAYVTTIRVWHKGSKSVSKMPLSLVQNRICDHILVRYEFWPSHAFFLYLVIPFIVFYCPLLFLGELRRYVNFRAIMVSYVEGIALSLKQITNPIFSKSIKGKQHADLKVKESSGKVAEILSL